MKDFDSSVNIFLEKLQTRLMRAQPRVFPLRFASFQKPLIVCFFISGACGLIYEICWLRMMGLIFGNTTFATSTVLAGYMAGLGFGAYFGGKWLSAKASSVKTYALLEAGVGLYALLTPVIWKLIDGLNVVFYRLFLPSFFTAILFKFAVVFIALLIPTFLMGATLPALASFFVHEKKETARGIGLLYALNTFGAVFGVLFSAFFALHVLGVWQTVFLTAALNLFIFWLLFYGELTVRPSAQPAAAVTSPAAAQILENFSGRASVPSAILLFCFALSGAVSMMYEIGWTRILAMSLGSSVYAFSIMLATFLLGIALGSYLFSLAAKRLKIDLIVFSFLQVLTGVFGLTGMNFFNDMPYYFIQLFQFSKGIGLKFEFGKFFLAGMVMLPPTLLIGAMFACFIHIYRRFQPLGSEIGQAYFTNTIGTILGSVLTGFVLIPLIGIRNTLLLAAAINIGIGILLMLLARSDLKGRLAVTAGILALVVWSVINIQPWNIKVLTSDIAVKPFTRVGVSKQNMNRSMGEREILFYKEGTNATVTVAKSRDNLSLAVNGKVDASNADTFTQFFLGHLPMMLHADPRKVLVIGIGSGSTMAAVASYPVEKIDAVELEPAVVEGARFFHELNRNVLDDSRVRIHINDGRNFARVTQNTYDVIISEPSNPWMAGVANLFSYEHYLSMGRKLNPGGVVCQWLHGYSMSSDDVRMIIKTFTQSYKHTMLWTSYYPDLMLIGSNDPLAIDFNRVRAAFEIPQVKADLAPHGLTAPEALLANFWLGDEDLRRLSEGGKMNRDNFPRLEFSAPRSLYKETVLENFLMLDSYRTVDFPPVLHVEPPPAQDIVFHKALIRAAITGKMFRKAARVLGQAKTMTTGRDGDLLLLEGMLIMRAGDADAALERLTQAATALPLSAEAHFYLAQALQGKSKLPEARQEFEIAAELDPANLHYVSALAGHLMSMDKSREALALFEKIIRESKEPFDAWAQRVSILSKIGTNPEFIAAAEELVSRYPVFPQGYELLAMGLAAQGDNQRAFENYKKALELQADRADLFLKLAELSDRLGRPADVQKYVRKAISLNPDLAQNPQLQNIANKPV